MKARLKYLCELCGQREKNSSNRVVNDNGIIRTVCDICFNRRKEDGTLKGWMGEHKPLEPGQIVVRGFKVYDAKAELVFERWDGDE